MGGGESFRNSINTIRCEIKDRFLRFAKVRCEISLKFEQH